MNDKNDDRTSPPSSIVLHQTEDGRNRIEVRLENETVWLTQQLMAELFQTTKQNVGQHLKNIFAEGELQQNSVVKNLNERVVTAARCVLEVRGYVAPIELLMQMQLLAPSNVRFGEKGGTDCLEPVIQGSAEKLAKTFGMLQEWARAEGLVSVKATLCAAGRDQSHELRVTANADPVMEEFYRVNS